MRGKCPEVPSGEVAGPRSHGLTGAGVGTEPEPARLSGFPEGASSLPAGAEPPSPPAEGSAPWRPPAAAAGTARPTGATGTRRSRARPPGPGRENPGRRPRAGAASPSPAPAARAPPAPPSPLSRDAPRPRPDQSRAPTRQRGDGASGRSRMNHSHAEGGRAGGLLLEFRGEKRNPQLKTTATATMEHIHGGERL